MGHTDHHTLLNRGRKSGLRTTELYSALNARQPQTVDLQHGQGDSNGFVNVFDKQGHPTYKPRDGHNR